MSRLLSSAYVKERVVWSRSAKVSEKRYASILCKLQFHKIATYAKVLSVNIDVIRRPNAHTVL
jgi:alpha-N-acetylglucosamine transferase